ncbi:hypothetical protein [Rhodopirellula halodulae]|nr:hypothetical protein [Rhodopirellula sp. JC740]
MPISNDDLFVLYADATALIDTPYTDGEYFAFGRVYLPKSSHRIH